MSINKYFNSMWQSTVKSHDSVVEKWSSNGFLHNIWYKGIFTYPLLAMLMTELCIKYWISMDERFLSSVFFVWMFFIYWVTMNSANERRFRVFDEFANISWAILAIIMVAKTVNIDKNAIKVIQKGYDELIEDIVKLLSATDVKVKKSDYHVIDDCSVRVISQLLNSWVPESYMAQVYQFNSRILIAFENLLTIKYQRTPVILRMFLHFTLSISVFIMAPEFALIGYWGMPASFLVAFLLISLIQIQRSIENPFGRDVDDIKFDFIDIFRARVNEQS